MGAFRKVQPSVIYSFLLHAGLLLTWIFFASRVEVSAPVHAPRYTMIEVDPLPKNLDGKTKNQVVQTEQATPSEKAASEAFLGERTQTVQKQTVSMPKTGTAAKTTKAKPVTQAKTDTTEPERSTEEVKAAKTPVITATGALAKFGIAISATEAESPKPKRSRVIEEASVTAQVRGEYVKGFKDGEQTMLNTREFVFYSYFQRVRERLDREWEKSLRDRLTKYFYRGRQLASEQDYSTQLLVSLDPAGKILKVQIIGASGTKELDEAAIKAFNDAGPFPNPPKGLVDTSGQVMVRWDFVLKT